MLYLEVSPGLEVGLSLVDLDGCRVHVNFVKEKLINLLGAAQHVKAQAARLLAAADGIWARVQTLVGVSVLWECGNRWKEPSGRAPISIAIRNSSIRLLSIVAVTISATGMAGSMATSMGAEVLPFLASVVCRGQCSNA